MTFTQDGKDLVVSMTVEVPDAPHVVWVHSTLHMMADPDLRGPKYPPKLGWVELAYQIIQCQDDPVRIQQSYLKKKVEGRWRLADHRRANVRYIVREQFSPTAAELKDLAPKLAKLAEVTGAGATVKEPAHDVGGGRLVATVTDPDGNVLGLIQDR